MMRYLLSICALFLFSAASLAQTPKKVENWQVFSPPSDEFSVETPLNLRQEGDNAEKSSRKFFGEINGVYVYVFSDPMKTQTYFSTVRNILPTIGQSAEALSTDGGGSKNVSFKDTFGYWHNLITVRTETRVYIAQTVTLDEKNEVASRFIRSFEIGPRPQLVQLAELAVEPKSTDLKAASATQGIGQGSGSGFGSGSGVDSGSSGTGSVPPAPPTGQTSGIRLLTKARPAYTDIARIYEISGTVMLRVTFLGSGQIGSVIPVTQVPFGLTLKAIEAAKRITFEPAYNNGSPQTVTKQIEYTFAIY